MAQPPCYDRHVDLFLPQFISVSTGELVASNDATRAYFSSNTTACALLRWHEASPLDVCCSCRKLPKHGY